MSDTEDTREHFTTVAIGRRGEVYDLRYEHPSWVQEKTEGKKDTYLCPVINSFTCTLQEATRLKQKRKKKK